MVGSDSARALRDREAVDRLHCPLGGPVIAVQPVGHEPQRFGRDVQAAVGEQQLDERREQRVVRVRDANDRGDRESRLEVGEPRRPGRRHFVRDHHQRPAAVLRLVPGMEQLFLVALLGLIEQPAADPLDEAAGEQASGPSAAGR